MGTVASRGVGGWRRDDCPRAGDGDVGGGGAPRASAALRKTRGAGDSNETSLRNFRRPRDVYIGDDITAGPQRQPAVIRKSLSVPTQN